jgi:hypothetical protein
VVRTNLARYLGLDTLMSDLATCGVSLAGYLGLPANAGLCLLKAAGAFVVVT